MLQELFEAIGLQAVKAAEVQIVAPPAEPKHRYAIRMPDGSLNWHFAEPAQRNHKAYDLATLAKRIQDDSDGAVVWYSRHAVTGLFVDATRRDQVSMAISASPQIVALQVLEQNRKAMKQADIVQFLRVSMKDTLATTGNLLEIVRTVKFSVNEQGGAKVEHTKRSVGRSLDAELTGAGALPEYVTFDCPVFANGTLGAIREPVECALEVDPATQTFQLLPLPGRIEIALTRGEAKLGEMLTELLPEEIPAFYGVP